MFNEEFLSRIFMNEDMKSVPIGCQATVVKVFEDEIEKMAKERPYVQLSELLYTTDADAD